MVDLKIKVGDVGVIVKAKHRWNNGKKVVITEIDDREDCYHAHLIADSKETFLLGQRNFQPIGG